MISQLSTKLPSALFSLTSPRYLRQRYVLSQHTLEGYFLDVTLNFTFGSYFGLDMASSLALWRQSIDHNLFFICHARFFLLCLPPLLIPSPSFSMVVVSQLNVENWNALYASLLDLFETPGNRLAAELGVLQMGVFIDFNLTRRK